MVVNAIPSYLSEISATFPRVSVVGVGDEGTGIVSGVFQNGGSGAQCIVVNTDKGPLDHAYSHEKVLIPRDVTDDSGDRDDLEARETAIEESARLMTPLLTGADIVFVVAKMKEGKAASVAPLVADVARRSGAVTIGMATMPPPFEREDKLRAYHGLAKMRQSCHTVAITGAGRSIQSARYLQNLSGDSPDMVVLDMVSGLAETLACPSAVNIDPAAFRELMVHGGIAHVGIAHSSSPLRVEEATIAALRGPQLYDNVARTRGVLLNVRGDQSFTVDEAQRAAQLVSERVGWDTPVVMGARVDESWSDGFQVSMLLTGGAYPYIPGGYRRLPLEMYEMDPDGEEEGSIDLQLDLDQLEE